MQQSPHYNDCVEEITAFFVQRIAFAMQHGIAHERIIVDPGIGFGKRLEDNLDLLGSLHRFAQFGLPLLVGASRKSFITKVTGAQTSPTERLGGSIAAAIVAVQNGANIIRVHDVAATVEALKVARAIAERI
jgi:dihydropteroate synthase